MASDRYKDLFTLINYQLQELDSARKEIISAREKIKSPTQMEANIGTLIRVLQAEREIMRERESLLRRQKKLERSRWAIDVK